MIGDRNGATIATVEHLMAALAGLGVDNALVEIDGPETPIMDGSAAQFVAAIDSVGLVTQARRRKYLKVLQIGLCRAWPLPRRTETRRRAAFSVDVEIDFEVAAIGRQRRAFDIDPQTFRSEIARARTFGFVADVKKLWAAGFALGSSLENSVALDGDRVLNPEGLRYRDEFVRHKALDVVGDLALAGAPILGAYQAYRPGHALNAAMLGACSPTRRITRSSRARRAARCAPALLRRAGWRRRSPPTPTNGAGAAKSELRRFGAIFHAD